VPEKRKLAAILAADVVGFSRLAGADEDRTLARLRTLRSDLIDPTIAVHHGRVVKRMGDGVLVEFRSVVDAVRCAIEMQHGMVERNAGLPVERRIEFRVGIHLGDVVEEGDGDLMGDGVNIAARLEGVSKPGAICLSEDAYRQVRARLDLAVSDLGETQLKNIVHPVRVYSLEVGVPSQSKPLAEAKLAQAPTGQWSRRGLVMASALGAALLVIGGAVFYLRPFAHPPSPEGLRGQQTSAAVPAPPSLSQPVTPAVKSEPSAPLQAPPPSPPTPVVAPSPAPEPPLATPPRIPPSETPSAAPFSPDEAAWRTAVAANTIAGFNEYLRASPAGAHAEEAKLQIADLILSSPTKSNVYDGRWLTMISCPAFGRALGYSQELSAEVKDGVYHGGLGTIGQPGSVVIDGKIVSDGTSALFAKGSVGSTIVSGGSAVGTPYFFHVIAQFEHSHGTGKRIEFRPCNLTFIRQ
jgi:class 3 adenylate cyclase